MCALGVSVPIATLPSASIVTSTAELEGTPCPMRNLLAPADHVLSDATIKNVAPPAVLLSNAKTELYEVAVPPNVNFACVAGATPIPISPSPSIIITERESVTSYISKLPLAVCPSTILQLEVVEPVFCISKPTMLFAATSVFTIVVPADFSRWSI